MARGPKPKPLAVKFDQYAVRSKGCWSWTGITTPNGYGILYIASRKRIGAHRASWQLHRGPIPAGLHVLHRCDNPPCTNPEHLFLGTHSDNMKDAAKKDRHKGPGVSGDSHYLRKRTHCKNGHRYTAKNTGWLADGTRQCRACIREAGRRWRDKHPIAPMEKVCHNATKTHCVHGHPFDESNIYISAG